MTATNPQQATTFKLTSADQAIDFGAKTDIDVTTTMTAGVYGDDSFDWSITNAGRITGDSTILLDGSDDTVVNTGKLVLAAGTADYDVVYIKGTGSVTNAGTITGVDHAVYIKGGGTIVNKATGKVTGNLVLAGTGSITNAGSIVGQGNHHSAIVLDGGGTASNKGSISVGVNEYGSGIYVKTTGTVTNSGSITLSGEHHAGIDLEAASGATNSGVITFTGSYFSGALTASASGRFDNAKTGVIKGVAASHADGIEVGDGGSATNEGLISLKGGPHLSGIQLDAGGTATNKGTVSTNGSYTAGVELKAGGTFTNFGKVVDTGPDTHGSGVDLKDGGMVLNNAGATIKSTRTAIFTAGATGATITDSGVISGKYSVQFTDSGANYLTLDTGAELIGAATGSTATGASNALTFEGKGVADNAFEGFGALTVDSGADWTLGGAATIGDTIVEGALTVGKTGSLTGGLTLEGGTAIFKSEFSGAVTFDGAGGLGLSDPYDGLVSGFGADDAIDFLSDKFVSGDKLALSADDVLTVETAGGTAIVSVTLTGAYTLSDFNVDADKTGHILVSHT